MKGSGDVTVSHSRSISPSLGPAPAQQQKKIKTYFSSLKNVIKQKPIVNLKTEVPSGGKRSKQVQPKPKMMKSPAHQLVHSRARSPSQPQKSINLRYDLANEHQSMLSHVHTRELIPEVFNSSTDRQMESRDFESSFLARQQPMPGTELTMQPDTFLRKDHTQPFSIEAGNMAQQRVSAAGPIRHNLGNVSKTQRSILTQSVQARGDCKGTEVSVASRASVPNAAVMLMPGIKAARDSTCTVPRGGNRLSPRNQ